MGSGKYFATATCAVTSGGNIVATKHLLTDRLMAILDVFMCLMYNYKCGPMPNVMVALPNRWRPLFNAAKFG